MNDPPYRLIALVMSRAQCYQAICAELNNMRGPVRKFDAKQLTETLSGTDDMTDNLMSRFGAPWTQQSRRQIQAA